MAEAKADKEPSIEEILESIRQIISEDDPAAAKPAETTLGPPPAEPIDKVVPLSLTPEPAPVDNGPGDVLELTDKVDTPMKSDLDLSVMEPVMSDNGGKLLSESATEASAAAMAKLLAGHAPAPSAPMTGGQLTLEALISELVRPFVKSWLDQNLSGLVEKMVQKEIERISRKAQDQ